MPKFYWYKEIFVPKDEDDHIIISTIETKLKKLKKFNIISLFY